MLSPYEVPVYARIPVRVARGRGCTLWDEAGREYLDMYGGHAVAVTGHCHPRVVAAVQAQAERLLFYSNAVPLAVRDELLELLAGMVPDGLGHVFLVNSGAEANEQALALARRLTGRPGVVSVAGGFHGRTVATLAASGIQHYRDLAVSGGGAELAARTIVVPFDDAGALSAAVDDATAAVILEPVQGLAGARDLSEAFLRRAREACDAHGALLVFDEVQCGTGRPGAFTASQLYGVRPDVLTLAKGIAAGVPMGAVMMTAEAASELKAGDLGTTFGGGPVACAAALANLAVIRDEDLPGNAARMEAFLRRRLAGLPGVQRVTGKGLLLGAVLDRPAREVQGALLDRGVIAGSSVDPAVLRLLPPLVLGEADADRFAEVLEEVLA